MISDFFISHLDASVRIIFDFVNAHDPMLRRVSFFKHVKLEIFVANLGISHTIITCRFAWKEDLMDNIKYYLDIQFKVLITSFCVHLAKPVVAQFVHETV